MNTDKCFSVLGILAIAFLIQSCGSSEKSRSVGNPAKDSVVIELTGQDSVTVIDLLTRSHHVQTKSTAMGLFVTAIDSIANSSAGSWVYSVNDTMPEIASDKLRTRAGDRIKWHFRKQ